LLLLFAARSNATCSAIPAIQTVDACACTVAEVRASSAANCDCVAVYDDDPIALKYVWTAVASACTAFVAVEKADSAT